MSPLTLGKIVLGPRAIKEVQVRSEPRLYRRNAALCLDCEALFLMALNQCPACASRTFVALTQFTERKKETP